MICKKNLRLNEEENKDEINDLKDFIKEFGIEKIETIRIVKKPNFWKNYLVLTIGVIEVTVGVILLVKSGGSNHKIDQFAFFLIKQGFNDIILSFQKIMEGKEIDLKEWGLKKGVEYAKGILTIAIGSCPGIANTSALTNEIISVTCKYAAQKSAEILENQLIKKGGSILQEICSKCITEPLMKGIKSKYFSDNKYFVMDLVNGDSGFENFIVGKTINTFKCISKSVLIMGPIIKHIRIIIKERSLTSTIEGLLKLIPTLKSVFS